MLKQPERLIILFVLSVMFFTSIPFATTCYCNSCSSCTAALNNPTCTKVVLNRDVQLSSPSQVCIKSSIGFRNKVFDCQGHSFEYLGARSPINTFSTWNGTIALNYSFSTTSYPLPPPVQLNFTVENCGFENIVSPIYIKNLANISIFNTTYYNTTTGWIISNTNNTKINSAVLVNCSSLAYITNINPGASAAQLLADARSGRVFLSISNVKYVNQTGTSPVFYPPFLFGIISQYSTFGPVHLVNFTFVNLYSVTCNLTCWLYANLGYGAGQMGYIAYIVQGTKIENWKEVNSGFTIYLDTFDRSQLSNLKLNATEVRYSDEFEYDVLSNLTILDFVGASDGPTYVSPTYLSNALAFSRFNHIHALGFSFDYSYKSNFTNIYVSNGVGFLFPCGVVRTGLNSWYPQVQYSFPYGNRFVNLTLINNTPYDLDFLYRNMSALLENNFWKNLTSNNHRQILVLTGTDLKINGGTYAEAVLDLRNSVVSNMNLQGSPTRRNDGLVVAGNNITVVNITSNGNFAGLLTSYYPKCYGITVINSEFKDNVYGLYFRASKSTLNKDLIVNNVFGIYLSGKSNIVKNSRVENNQFYDVSPFMIYYPDIWCWVCSTQLGQVDKDVCFGTSFTNNTLSGGRRLAIINKSNTYLKNKEFSQMIICSNDSIIQNVTVLGNKSIKNNGIALTGNNNKLIHVIGDYTNMGLCLAVKNNHTLVVNSSFSYDNDTGIVLTGYQVFDSSTSQWIDRPTYDKVYNVTVEHEPRGVGVYSSSNTLSNISACFDWVQSFYFDRYSIDNTGSSNLGNITDLGTNPGFSADAGICYLSLLKPVFVPPTPANNSILSSTSITLNATSSDPTLTNITLNLYNNTGLVQKVICTSSPCSYSFTGLKLNQNYYFNATACDAEKQCASTSTYTTYLSPTTCALVLVVKNHLNKALYIDAVKIGSEEYNVGHVLLLPYQSKAIRIENNGFCHYLGRVVFLDMTLYFSDASHMTYEVSGEIALNS